MNSLLTLSDSFEESNPIQVDNLMKNAADKYKTLLQKGKWSAPDANKAKILALQAELKKLKKKKGVANNKKGDGSKRSNGEKSQWFSKRPTKNKLHKTKEWKGKKWYYCHPDTGGKCDGIWRQHKPS